jgi:hypothetical protein
MTANGQGVGSRFRPQRPSGMSHREKSRPEQTFPSAYSIPGTPYIWRMSAPGGRVCRARAEQPSRVTGFESRGKSPPPRTLLVSAAILVDPSTKKILLAERPKGEFQGCFEFPGGKVEPQESPEEAICRELREELGIVVKASDLTPVRIDACSPRRAGRPDQLARSPTRT